MTTFEHCPHCGGKLTPDPKLRKPRCDRHGLIWIKRDLAMVAVSKMDLSHLTNTAEMLKRNAKPRLERCGYDADTDAAIIYPIINELEAEIDRRLHQKRGLEILTKTPERN